MNNIMATLMAYGADTGGILGGLASLMVLAAALRKWIRRRRKRRRCHRHQVGSAIARPHE